jgi:hypothetical protein
MSDSNIDDALRALGMDKTSFRALPLLPLVQVAWADGRIQNEERALIMDIARTTYELSEDGLLLLDNWLHHPPSKAYVERGQETLIALCRRERATHPNRNLLTDVITLSEQVASAAGGFFGLGAITRTETDALKKIAKALSIPTNMAWVAPTDQTAISDLPIDTGRITVEFHTDELQNIKSKGRLVQRDHIVGLQSCPINQEGLTIGRWKELEVRISYDGTVSRRHCRIYEHNRRFFIEDLDSAQGTWVNGERVMKRRLLGREEIRVGITRFTFELT